VLKEYNFTTAILMLAAMIGVTMLAPIFLTERRGEKIMPWSSGKSSPETEKIQLHSWKIIFKSLYRVFRLRNSILLVLILFITQGAYNYMGTLLPIFTVKELGWTNVSYSQFFATAKLIGGIGGMLIGGYLIDRFGKKEMMSIYFILLVILTSAFAYMKADWVSKSFVYAFMISYNVLDTFATIGIFAISMQCCWKKVSASQFTLYMTISNLGRIALAALIGPIKENFSWQITLVAFAVMIAIVLVLLQLLNIHRHVQKVDELEKRDAEGLVLAMAGN
jgi:PAT family beta-lactamase induction signal transducer AmpG